MTSQNAKGPATAPTVPSHGSSIPQKDIEMNVETNSTAPAEKKATDKEVAWAMRSLESAVRELMHMAEIAADSFDTVFGPSSRIASSGDNGVTYKITKHEDDQMSFLINDVDARCSMLNKAFHAAWNGEELA